MYNELEDIIGRFLRHISSIERLLDQDIQTVKRPKNADLGELINYVLHLKFNLLEAENNCDTERIAEIQQDLKDLESDEFYNLIDCKTVVHYENGIYSYKIDSMLLKSAYISYTENQIDESYDTRQYSNSLIVSIVIGMEILISNIFKHYINHLDTSNQIIKDKPMTYEDLKKFDSLEDARIYLQDQYIDNLLRSSFEGWLNELESKLKINLRKEIIIKDDIDMIVELFQRRHLIIHNDGIVNDFYIKKVSQALQENVVKGEELDLNKNYISSRLKIIQKFGLVLIFCYADKIFKKDKDRFFKTFNSILLTVIHTNCEGVKYFFEQFSKFQMDHSYMLISKVNYFLSYRIPGDDSINNEIEAFNTTSLSLNFQVAKSILLENDDAPGLAVEYFKTLDDNEFINVLEWPLFKLLKHDSKSIRYIKTRLNRVIKKEMSLNAE